MKSFLIAFNILVSFNLAFVSVCFAKSPTTTKLSPTNDEFAEFEAELDSAEGRPKSRKPKAKKSAPSDEVTPSDSPSHDKLAALSPEQKEEQIARLKKEIQEQPQAYAKMVELAEVQASKGDFKSSSDLLWKNVAHIGRPGLIRLAKSHLASKEYGDAHRALNLLVSKNEKDYEAQSLKGEAFFGEKKKTEALEAFAAALAVKPNYEPAYLAMANHYENTQPPNLYELRVIYQDMVKNIGNRAQYLQKICEVNFLDAVYEATVSTCKTAILKNSQIPDAHVYLGAAYNYLGDIKQAGSVLKKTSLKFPQSELALYYYGNYLEEQKNFLDAYAVFEKAAKLDAKSARSWLGYAKTSFELKKYAEAYDAFKKSCLLDKKTAPAFRKAASVLRLSKNSEWSGKFEETSSTCTF